jgi:transposase
LNEINAYEFYARYDTVKYSSKALLAGGLSFIHTEYFIHPSYNHAQNHHKEIIIKRDIKALIKIQQYAFTDTANFVGRNIHHDTTDITEDMEHYCFLILLLFHPYRSIHDLQLHGSFTYKFRQACQNNIITDKQLQIISSKHSRF